MVSKSEFSGKSYLISGAASGVGADICRELLIHGAYVYALDFNESALKKFEKEVNLPNNLKIICTDISSEIFVKASIESLNFTDDKLDGLVNAAAIVNAKRFTDFDQSDWEKTFSTNLFGTYYLIKHLTPFLINSDSPKIVNFASMAGKIAGQYTAPYAASKAAIISLTRSAAIALAPKVNVNSICPGIIETPMWDALGADLEKVGIKDHFKNRSSQSPLAREGKSMEVAQATLFLLSNAAAYITGEDLNISGGLVMH
jgi:NAD(P)-dependent dehydrogenase (short-subunit alcohol dehydrogenase family)